MSKDNHCLSEAKSLLPDSPISSTAQRVRFANLNSAGCHLARSLEQFKARKDVIVLGLVLGGVPVAVEVARDLDIPLDFIILRRLLTPQGPGSQICAVNVAGSLVIDEELMPRPAVSKSGLDHFISDALEELAHREQVCRGGRPSVQLRQKTILLVDCGIRTGLTMTAAIHALRKKEPAKIVAAVPVASAEGYSTVEELADEVVCLDWPEPFGHVGLWYQDFSRPDDHQISELLG